ncbi:MAG: hypothetical protein AAF725_02610 [Acidobacteriota bacterium]
MGFRHLAGFLALMILASSVGAELAPRIARYADAEYKRSHDPLKAILTLHGELDWDAISVTLVVYGDGRMEYSDTRGGAGAGQMAAEDLDALFDRAVSHGLAEWDSDTVRAWHLQDLGTVFPGMTDAARFRTIIALESYERGSYRVTDAVRSVDTKSPDYASEILPDIPQYVVLAELSKLLWDHRRKWGAK